ncbi:MAG: cyclic nucleotide-binding domain-containing protein, partial [Chloroflexi bacterium]|nr:cyclic nucleotide-binding domain-containing protein [Chloroflexota bacterium]
MVDITRLRRFKILQSLSDDKLAELAPQFGEELRPRNEIIFREGEPGDFFYLIESGQVSARKQQAEGDEFLGYFLAGDFFGERALLTDEGRYATVDAVLQVALLTLGKDDFLALCEAHPPVRAAIEAVAAERDRRRMVTFPGRRLDEALIIATHRHIVWVAARALRWSLAVGVPWLVASAFL